jgi:hypothetical protein
LNPTADADLPPVTTTFLGDGLSVFDEYRGFRVSNIYTRTDPRVKDLFVRLVNPQCGTSTLLSTYPTDGTSLFGNVNTLISGAHVHLLDYKDHMANAPTTTEWQDHFKKFEVVKVGSGPSATFQGRFTYTTGLNGDGSDTTIAPPADRQINVNALFPITDTDTGLKIQKGLRITECLNTSDPSLLGIAGWGSANGPDNAVIYTTRIKDYVGKTLGKNKTPKYYTFINTAWVNVVPGTLNLDFLISKAIQYYLAMEIGHSIRLTDTSTYEFHHPPETGSNMDQSFVVKDETNTIKAFYIPSAYNTTDQMNFKLKD